MGSFRNRFIPFLNRFSSAIYSRRNFISERALGLDKFTNKVMENSAEDVLEYKNVVRDVCQTEKHVPFHVIKIFVYMIKTEDDITLFEKLITKYGREKLNAKLLFANFSIGSEIMKMYYTLNQPERALALIKNNLFSAIFNTFKPYIILQHMLFKKEMHSQVCEVFNILQQKQLQGEMFPLINYHFYQASCYKMNTDESFNDAMKTYEKFIKYKSKPHLNMVIYTVLFALNRGFHTLALKHCKSGTTVEINMKLLALTMAGNLEEALHYWAVEVENKFEITQSVWETLCLKLEDDTLKSMNKSHQKEFLNFKESSSSLQDLTLEYLTEKYLENKIMDLQPFRKKKNVHSN